MICHTCELTTHRDSGEAPLWDSIFRTQYWDVVHAYNTALLGWLVLVARRHIAAIDEMTEDEALEMGKLVRELSLVLKEQTGCLKTYVVQFAEAPTHQHVHFHVVARMPDQPEDCKGPNIFKYLGVPDEQRVSETDMNNLGLQIRNSLLKMQPKNAP
jgi:diadenosine tetraphosphate (Ap4A) HIT family hydrolase